MTCCAVLYCTVLYCTVLYCNVLYRYALWCTALYCALQRCTVLCSALPILSTLPATLNLYSHPSCRTLLLLQVTNRYARNLISMLLSKDPIRRPSPSRVLDHPFLSNKRYLMPCFPLLYFALPCIALLHFTLLLPPHMTSNYVIWHKLPSCSPALPCFVFASHHTTLISLKAHVAPLFTSLDSLNHS